MTTTAAVLATTTVRPGDVVLLDGVYQIVGELFDEGANIELVFKYGTAVLHTSTRRSYAEIEAIKVGSRIPRNHEASCKPGYNQCVRYQATLALHGGVIG